MDFIQALRERRLFFDGATGTVLQRHGLKPGEPPERFNIDAPEVVRGVHREYLDAGADIITANTFGAYAHKFDNAPQLIRAALENARAALAGRNGWVALDMGPTGRLLAPMGDMGFEECYDLFAEAARAGAECGADLIIIETMPDPYEVKAAVLAAKATGLPVLATMTFNENGRTLTGASPGLMATLLEGLSVNAMGMNCGFGPSLYEKLLPGILEATDMPVILQPNAGLPVVTEQGTRYDLSPDEFAAHMRAMAGQGIQVLGGCCGTDPSYIKALVNACRGEAFAPSRRAPGKPVICSGARTAEVDIQAGYNALPLQRCLSVDPDDMAEEAMDLSESAEIVEICVTDPSDVVTVQELVRVPLSLDARTPEVLLGAVRLYNGRPMVPAASVAFGDSTASREELTKALAVYGAVIV